MDDFNFNGFDWLAKPSIPIKTGNIDLFYDTMTKGMKQHMANRLWKRDGIVAQKFKQYLPEEKTYKIGTIFENKDAHEEFILAMPDRNKACLISIKDGNRWREPINIVSNGRVTLSEMERIVGGVDSFGEVAS